MKRQIVVLIFMALSVSSSAGQTSSSPASQQRCNLTPAQLPEIRGLRLGMSIEQLMNLFPEETNRASIRRAVEESKHADNFGAGNLGVQSENRTPNSRFTGVSVIFVTLLDERVAGFSVNYIGPQWDNVDQFVNRLAEAFNLPHAEAWSVGAGGADIKVLRCNGFEMQVRSSAAARGSNSLWVSDPSVNRVLEARRRQVREEAQRAFRP